jgi:hypothetical protein
MEDGGRPDSAGLQLRRSMFDVRCSMLPSSPPPRHFHPGSIPRTPLLASPNPPLNQPLNLPRHHLFIEPLGPEHHDRPHKPRHHQRRQLRVRVVKLPDLIPPSNRPLDQIRQFSPLRRKLPLSHHRPRRTHKLEEMRMRKREPRQLPHDPPHRLRGGKLAAAERRREAVHQRRESVINQGKIQFLLGLVIDVKRPLSDLCRRRHVVQFDLVKRPRREQPRRRLGDQPPLLLVRTLHRTAASLAAKGT